MTEKTRKTAKVWVGQLPHLIKRYGEDAAPWSIRWCEWQTQSDGTQKRMRPVKTFGPGYLVHINEITGRIHCSYFPFTGAGRYACSKPNLQQIPRDAVFRMCFMFDQAWEDGGCACCMASSF